MSPRAALAALASPLTQPVLLLAALGFYAIVAVGLALYALFSGAFYLLGLVVLGIALAVAVPAWLGYLLKLIESRALGRSPPVAELDLFLPGGSGRQLFPLVPLALLLGAGALLGSASPALAAAVVGALAVAWLPGHFMLLALTNSPLASVNPLALWRLYRRLWPGVLWLPAALAVAVATLAADLPFALDAALAVLWGLALASLAGELLASLDVAAETDIAPPVAARPGTEETRTLAARTRVLNHAYGLISRGNRDGGFRHIEHYLATDPDPGAADLWFFAELWHGELGEAPLFYAQGLLRRLLAAGEDTAAMKVTLRCLAANARFRPHAEDLPALLAAAEALGNRDVLAAYRR